MHSDVYHCDKCGEKLPDGYEANHHGEQLWIINEETERFVGAPECHYEKKDICLACLVKAMKRWFYNKAKAGKDPSKPDTFDFSESIKFCEMLEEKKAENGE